MNPDKVPSDVNSQEPKAAPVLSPVVLLMGGVASTLLLPVAPSQLLRFVELEVVVLAPGCQEFFADGVGPVCHHTIALAGVQGSGPRPGCDGASRQNPGMCVQV